MNLYSPVIVSIPTKDKSIPKIPDIKPFNIEPLDNPTIIESPNIDNKNISGEPNATTNFANGGDKNISAIHEINPPIVEAIVAIERASPPFPCLVNS